jgi:hypothetical protein
VDLTDLFFQEEIDALVDVKVHGAGEFKPLDESVADTVQYHECPECGHRWPK